MIGATPETAADMNTASLPTVAICTRDRPHSLARALASVLRSGDRFGQLLVIDQSAECRTGRLVRRFARLDARIDYSRDPGQGLARARNLALNLCSSRFMAFTDDDCEVQPGWLDTLVQAMERDEQSGLGFGQVIPTTCPRAAGFIVGYRPKRFQALKGKRGKLHDGGIGANMIVRTDCARLLGGFDVYLGAGGHFPSCEDGDFSYRALSRGWSVYHVPESRVQHFGLREWRGGAAFSRRTWVGVSAAYFKYVRCGDPFGLLLVAQQCAMAGANIAMNVVRLRRPLGFGRLLAIFEGLGRSFERRVEPQSRLYR
jgi:GT2 family glycosyltransferase